MLFCLLHALGVVTFGVSPLHGGSSWAMTLAMGALFDSFAYATYDLSNLATLRDWLLRLSLIDIGWGTLVSAVSAAGGRAALDGATHASP